MQVKNYWVGDRPGGAWTFQIRDQKSGAVADLTGYSRVFCLLKGSDNEDIEISPLNVMISNPAQGIVTLLWPTESLFTKPGRYVMQLKLENPQTTRTTTVQEILIRELGGVTK